MNKIKQIYNDRFKKLLTSLNKELVSYHKETVPLVTSDIIHALEDKKVK